MRIRNPADVIERVCGRVLNLVIQDFKTKHALLVRAIPLFSISGDQGAKQRRHAHVRHTL